MGEWPLVGRVVELARLRALLEGRGHRRPAGVVLAAPPGVGKTRLAREAMHVAEGLHHAVAWVTATRSAATLPLGAFGPLLPPRTTQTADRAGLLRHAAAAVVEGAAGRRLTLFVDDAHLLDDASATLVHQLVLDRRAFVVVTLLTGEPAPDPVVALWKDDLLERIELRALDAAAMADLVGQVLGGPVDPAAVAALVERAHGNVLVLRELLLGALDHGVLRRTRGFWMLTGPLAPSDRLVELVGLRVDELAPAERELVELLACAEVIGAAELEAVTAGPVVEHLERAGIVGVTRNVRRLEVRLGHTLYGDVVRRSIVPSSEQRIARTLAEVVEGCGSRRRDDVLRVATWRLTCGGADPMVMLDAAATARWRYDFPLAERLARAAAAHGPCFEAELLAAQLACLQGRSDDAEVELRRLAGAATTDEERARVAVVRLDNAVYGLHVDEGFRMAEAVEASLTDVRWRDEVAARRAMLQSAILGVRASAEIATELMAHATGRPFVVACIPAAYCYGRMGRTSAAIDAADRGYAAQLELDTPFDWYPWMHQDLRNLALDYAGYLDEAAAEGRELHAAAVRDGDREAQAAFALALAQQVGVRGDVRTSAAYAREAAALYRQDGRPAFLQYALLRLGLALALDLDRSHGELQRVLLELDELGPVPVNLVADEPETRAWVAVADGDLARARDVLAVGADSAERVGDLVGVMALLHATARLGRPGDVRRRLADLAVDIEGPLAPARVGHVDALDEGDAEGLERAGAVFEGIGALLLAAEAAADAGTAWARSGDARRSAACRRRAAAVADRCEGATTPALGAIEARAELTPAERETALLAAAGRSDRDIADSLHLSVRTVQNRLHRVYGKLGIGKRDELPAVLHPPERVP